MKLAITTSLLVNNIDFLKALNHEDLNNSDKKVIGLDVYVYYVNASEGIKPDSINNGLGRWKKEIKENVIFEAVDDDYDFIANLKTNVTSVVYLDRFSSLFNDYRVVQQSMKNHVLFIGWGSLSNSDRRIVVDYFAHDNDVDKITHLMSVEGLSQDDAERELINCWVVHNRKFTDSLSKRWVESMKIVSWYLNEVDLEDLWNEARYLINDMIQIGNLGQDYDDSKNGIMDYLLSTNGFNINDIPSGMEANGYILKHGDWIEFKNALKDCLIDGIY